MRDIGIHLRIEHSVLDVIRKAIELNLSTFQLFLIMQNTGKPIELSAEEIAQVREFSTRFPRVYVHGSYWINPASAMGVRQRALIKECALATALGFSHLVLHPGSMRGQDKPTALKALAKTLNDLAHRYPELTVIVENAAHGGQALGGDIADFVVLKELLKDPKRAVYCIDTAHAFVYGYDIRSDQQQDDFIGLLDQTIGLDSIGLIHLNDTKESLGSRIDQHACIDQGLIGLGALKRFISHPALCHVPIIMEMPVATQEDELRYIELVKE